MSVTTAQQLENYFTRYKNVEMAFNKDVIAVTGLVPKQIFLRCAGEHIPCIIYSISMSSAKIILNTKATNFFEVIKKANNLISLRFSFKMPEKKGDPVNFFVSGRVVGYNAYKKESPDYSFATIDFTQRPPDDLIEILGKILEANANSKKRAEERVIITNESIQDMGLTGKEAILYVQQVPRKCIVRDLSFGGAKIIMIGIAKLLMDKECDLRLQFGSLPRAQRIPGTIIRFEPIEGRKDIASLALQFNSEKLPMGYKVILSNYLGQKKS